MRAVNLLPNDSTRASRGTPQPAALAAAITGVVAVALVGGGNLFEQARVSSAMKTLNTAKIQLAATPLPPATPRVTPPPPAVAQQMQPRTDAVTAALATRIAWDRILREFSLVLPTDIQLNALTMTQPLGGVTSAPTSLQLSGFTYSYDGVARLLARMALIPDLTGVTLSNTSTNDHVVSFSISAGIKGAPAPAAPVVPPTVTTTGGTAS